MSKGRRLRISWEWKGTRCVYDREKMTNRELGRAGAQAQKKGSKKRDGMASEAYQRVHKLGGITVLEFGRRRRPLMFLRCKPKEIPE
jgi:hypothetical protein